MFLLLGTEHTSFNAFLPNPISYSLFTVPNHYAKPHLKTVVVMVKLNCAPLSCCLAAFEILGGLGCGDTSTFPLCQFFLSFLSNAISSVFQLLSDCSICLI